ncbi:MAG: hypothetical protein ACLFV8_13890 [Alphaproteobacteria bacterium]
MADSPLRAARKRRRRYRLLYRLEAGLEAPMFLLAVIWLWLFVDELLTGVSPWQQATVTGIWAIFILEFLLKLYLAPRRIAYIARNWITVVALAVPGFRVFRMLRAIRLLRATRVASTTRIVRSLTSARRFYKALQAAQGPAPKPEVNAAILIAASPGGEMSALQRFAAQLARDAGPEIQTASRIQWTFQTTAPVLLESDNPRRPSDFLDEASLRMAEGPYDLAIVVTDVALVSRRLRVVAGLVSPTSRIAVISTRKLVTAPRGRPVRRLEADSVRWNAGALLLRFLGRIGGLRSKGGRESEVMAPFAFQESRRTLPRFTGPEREALARTGARLPERELRGGGPVDSLVFHVLMVFRHPGDVLRPLLRNWAPLLPLSLPGLATAAVAPSFLLVFNAEIWDVGLTMSGAVAALYATISIMAASFYLVWAQALFLPRKEKRVLTEHLAVANGVIFLSILLACVGLFIMVVTLMMLIETFIFPAGLIRTWPTLNQPAVDLTDKLRLAAFIGTVGVTTGALAGGLESRTVIRHLALFEDESDGTP